LRLRKPWSSVRSGRFGGVRVGSEGEVVAVLSDVAVSMSSSTLACHFSRQSSIASARKRERGKRRREGRGRMDAPNPRQSLIPTLLHNLKVPHLNPTHREVRNLKLDRDRSAFVDFLCLHPTSTSLALPLAGLKKGKRGETYHPAQKATQSALASKTPSLLPTA
jgi:hypothetical protein